MQGSFKRVSAGAFQEPIYMSLREQLGGDLSMLLSSISSQ